MLERLIQDSMRGLWGVQEGIIKETFVVLTLNTSVDAMPGVKGTGW